MVVNNIRLDIPKITPPPIVNENKQQKQNSKISSIPSDDIFAVI